MCHALRHPAVEKSAVFVVVFGSCAQPETAPSPIPPQRRHGGWLALIVGSVRGLDVATRDVVAGGPASTSDHEHAPSQ
jgi:hypothetical protein